MRQPNGRWRGEHPRLPHQAGQECPVVCGAISDRRQFQVGPPLRHMAAFPRRPATPIRSTPRSGSPARHGCPARPGEDRPSTAACCSPMAPCRPSARRSGQPGEACTAGPCRPQACREGRSPCHVLPAHRIDPVPSSRSSISPFGPVAATAPTTCCPTPAISMPGGLTGKSPPPALQTPSPPRERARAEAKLPGKDIGRVRLRGYRECSIDFGFRQSGSTMSRDRRHSRPPKTRIRARNRHHRPDRRRATPNHPGKPPDPAQNKPRAVAMRDLRPALSESFKFHSLRYILNLRGAVRSGHCRCV